MNFLYFFGTFGATVKSAATFAIGAFGEMIIQSLNSDKINKDKVIFSGMMNMVGAHVTEPAIRGAQSLGIGTGAAVQAGWTIPATWGTDALFLDK